MRKKPQHENSHFDILMANELWNCAPEFKKLCPMQWKELEQTEDPSIRFCNQCEKNVYQCDTPEQFVQLGNEGRCVAVIPDASHHNMNVSFVGEPYEADVRAAERKAKIAVTWWQRIIDLAPNFDLEMVQEITRWVAGEARRVAGEARREQMRIAFPLWGTDELYVRLSQINEELSAGQIVRGTVAVHSPNGIWVDLGLEVPGFLELADMNDARITQRDIIGLYQIGSPIVAEIKCFMEIGWIALIEKDSYDQGSESHPSPPK